MQFDNYESFYNTAVEKYSNNNIRKKKYFHSKGQLFVKLVQTLNNKKLLKQYDAKQYEKLNKNFQTALRNFDHVKELTQLFYKLLKESKRKDKSTLLIKDDTVGEINITAQQIVTQVGWTYCTLCEILRQYLISIIDFKKITKQNPTGIGAAIKTLEDNGFPVDFFEDVDSKVRNSFFHFDFEFKEDKIFCDNYPSKYKDNKWRTEKDNSQKEYILLADLMVLVSHVDESMLPPMTFFVWHNQQKA